MACTGHAGPTDLPPLPPGYADDQEVMTAILLGKLKLIDPTKVMTPDTVEEILGIGYGAAGGRTLKLDLYLPRTRSERTPAILFLHGGAWKTGTRGQMKYYCLRFAERGYVTATATYRLADEAPFPAAVHDVKCAVRWLRAHAAKYQIDPNRIAVSGNSAGGHLALMVGYADDPSLEGTGGNAGVSSRVSAVVNFYGPTDLTTDFAKRQGVVEAFLGGKKFDEAPEAFRMASPLFHLTADDPPTLIFHGTIDSTVPVAQADKLAKRLEELQITCVYERYEGWPHVMDLAEAVNRRCVYQMAHFFHRHLGTQTEAPETPGPSATREQAARSPSGVGS
jgi:acetyl esterase/lipase